LCKDPSRMPQIVFLSLAKHDPNLAPHAQAHAARPRGVKSNHIFKVLVHIEAVEDMLFYHYSREELVADGNIPWWEFKWQMGKMDGDLEEEILEPPTRFCCQSRSRSREDDDFDRDQRRPRPRGLLEKMSGWMESRGRSKDRQSERSRGSNWYQGESSRAGNRRGRDISPPLSRDAMSAPERRALRLL
jgi:hypothetical protein